jgi:PAS domain S-box-containing protein
MIAASIHWARSAFIVATGIGSSPARRSRHQQARRQSLSKNPNRDAAALKSSSVVLFPQQPALQLIYDTAPIGLACLSPDCRYLQINQRLTEICGISVEDHLGRSVRECVPALAEAVEGIVSSIMQTGEPVTGIEVAGQRADQTDERFWITYWHPLRSPSGEIVGVNVAAEEITERKRTEKALRESEVRFRELANNISQFAWTADANGWIYWYNKRWHDYTGTTLEDMEGWGWQKVHHPEHVERVVNRIRDSFESGTPWEDTFPLRGADGSYRWFLSRALPIRNEAGEVIRWFGTNTDITKQIEAEKALQASERQFHTLADSIPQLVWMADAGGKIYWFNNHWHEYTGTSAGETSAHDWQAILAPASLEEARHRWAQTLETGAALEMELFLRGSDGQYRPFLTRAIPLRDSAAAIYGWIGTHIDISERKRSEQETRSARDAAEAALQNLQETQDFLIESEKLAALGRLVAGVAHEINNPVGTSLTVASSLERRTALFASEVAQGNLKRSSLSDFIEGTREASAQLIANLYRAAELIQSFKQVATDRNYSNQRVFDLGGLTEQVAVSLRPGLAKQNLTLNVKCQPDLTMHSYPGPYGQVLTNLFLNSVAHAFPDGKGGSIDIRVQAHGTVNVEIIFSDDGCGMSNDIRRKAFDPFFTTHRDRGGTGLGLHIVYNIVTGCLGGRLSLDSEPGEGTKIKLTLPRVAPAALAEH